MITVSERGIDGIQKYLEKYPAVAKQAALLAVSDTAQWARTYVKRTASLAVRLPPEVMSGGKFTVKVDRKAMSATVSASKNVMGLSRFVTSERKAGAKYPSTKIKIGGGVKQWGHPGVKGGDYAFLIPTPNGADGVALALRTKTPPRNTRAARKIGRDLYLLYGPSLDQIFGRYMPTLVPRVETYLQAEFARQFRRLNT